MFFDGFTLGTAMVSAGPLRYRMGGSGPALLLLHGNPQTHAMWHEVAPALARHFTVICPDLRGYGGSVKPAPSPGHETYAKAAMAADLTELMDRLGHQTFAVAGHERGARVAHRLALDLPDRVRKLAVLDFVPVIEPSTRKDMAFALGYYYACWFAQPHPFAEDLIEKGPNTWFTAHTGVGGIPSFFAPEALADYLAAANDPAAIAAMIDDYRACATVDVVHEQISRAEGKRIECPLLVLWGAQGKIGGWYDPTALWRDLCAGEVSGAALDCGHFLPEEAPKAVVQAFVSFF